MKPHCQSVPSARSNQLGQRARAVLAVFCAIGHGPVHASPVAITGTGSYSQNFDTLPASGATTWTDDSTLPGWYSQRTGSGTTIVANAGTSTSGDLYSYGSASTAERALGSLGSENATAGHFAHGVQLQNTSGAAATINFLAYTGEQWRKSGVTEAQVVTLWYKISPSSITTLNPEAGTSGWIAIAPGDFSSPVNAAGAGALDGNDPANKTAISINPNIVVPAGNFVMIRWKDPNHDGTDHGLAIDDVSLAWIASPVIPLSPGAIAFVGFNADGGGDLAFVALAPIAANDVIRFTDNPWNGSLVGDGGAFPSGEGVVTWTAPAGGVVAGTVVSLNNLSLSARSASVGTVVSSSGSLDLNAENETVYAYQGAPLIPSNFLAVIATHGDDSTSGTGLSPAHMIRLPDDEDIAAYTGSRSSQTSFASYLTLLGVSGNWVTEDGAGDQSTNITAPNVPFSSTAFTVTSGNTFASWLIANAPGESAAQDRDNDGLPNGVEYFMGTPGNAFSPHPGIVSGAVSWPRAAGTTIAAFGVEISTDLDTWEDANISYAANLSIGPSQVVFTMPSGPPKIFVRLNVTP